MPIEILMPALSPTMTEGNLANWLKKEGDSVEPGDVIAEIETDKATMEVEAVDEGTIGKILVAEGAQGVKVNAVIALLLEEGEDASVLEGYEVAQPEAEAPAAEDTSSAPEPVKEAPQPSAPAAPAPKPAAAPVQLVTATQAEYKPPVVASAPSGVALSGDVKASPAAKRLASKKNVDLRGVIGTGPHGRIVKADVEEAMHSGGGGKRIVRHQTPYQAVTNDMMRKTIAKRLLESKQTVPHFYLTVDCQMDRLLALRADLNSEAASDLAEGEKPAYKLSVNDFVIKAVALALRKVPTANASWNEDTTLFYNNIDVSVAVAIDGGLITPIVANADQKDLPNISNEMKELAARAKQGKLAPEEFQGGGFSISNLGMYGIKEFKAVINPPQGCILAVGSGEERAVVRDGKLTIANMMTVTLSCDHRVVDGAVGAEFLAAFKHYIERPGALVL